MQSLDWIVESLGCRKAHVWPDVCGCKTSAKQAGEKRRLVIPPALGPASQHLRAEEEEEEEEERGVRRKRRKKWKKETDFLRRDGNESQRSLRNESQSESQGIRGPVAMTNSGSRAPSLTRESSLEAPLAAGPCRLR